MKPELVLPFPLSNLRDWQGRPSGLWLRNSARPTEDNPHPGVVVEGESGSGKSTISALLAEDADDHGVPVFFSRYEVAMANAEQRLGIARADWGSREYIQMSGGFYLDIEATDEERIKRYPNSLHIIETISTEGDDFLDRAVSVVERLAFEQKRRDRTYDMTFAHLNADPHLQRKAMVLRLKVPQLEDSKVIDYLRDEHNVEIVGVEDSPEAGRFIKSIYEAQAIPERLYAITDQYIGMARRWAKKDYLIKNEIAQGLWVPSSVTDYDLPDPYQMLVPGAFTDRTPELQLAYRLKAAFSHFYMIKEILKLPHTKARALHNGFDLSRIVRWDVSHYQPSLRAA